MSNVQKRMSGAIKVMHVFVSLRPDLYHLSHTPPLCLGTSWRFTNLQIEMPLCRTSATNNGIEFLTQVVCHSFVSTCPRMLVCSRTNATVSTEGWVKNPVSNLKLTRFDTILKYHSFRAEVLFQWGFHEAYVLSFDASLVKPSLWYLWDCGVGTWRFFWAVVAKVRSTLVRSLDGAAVVVEVVVTPRPPGDPLPPRSIHRLGPCVTTN